MLRYFQYVTDDSRYPAYLHYFIITDDISNSIEYKKYGYCYAKSLNDNITYCLISRFLIEVYKQKVLDELAIIDVLE